jgi:hypothetical protein
MIDLKNKKNYNKAVHPAETRKTTRIDYLGRDRDLYKQISIGFVIIVVLFLGVVLYFFLARAVISIVPALDTVVIDAKITAVASASSAIDGADNNIPVKIITETINEEGPFVPTGDSESILEGKITIINNSGRAQTLVATTRFLTKDNKLFRIVSSVAVPSKGKVIAIARSDKPLFPSEVTSGHLVIPGLRLDLQSKIYGVLSQQFKSLESGNKINSDQEGKTIATRAILKKAFNVSRDNLKRQLQTDYLISEDVSHANILSAEVSPHPDRAVKTFTLKINAEISHVALSHADLAAFAREHVSSDFPDVKYYDVDKEATVLKLISLDNEKKEAKLDVSIKVRVLNKDILSLINKEDFVNKSKEWVVRYLKNFKEIQDVQVTFSPFWVTKTPSVLDHINIEIKPVVK